jgi:hypothetical protein
MRKSILLLFLINFFITGHAQIIKGTLRDKVTDSKISFATVYLNGTSVGTYSDGEGNFKLDITKYNSMPLTISALGYYSVTISDFPRDKTFVTYLVPKIFELNEVIINSKAIDKERKANIKIFRDEFLGTTANAKRCVIVNENDILFKNSTDRDTLKAFASKPLIIYNNGLGYKITYYLDKFEFYKKSKSFLYQGSAFFNGDLSSDPTQIKSFERRRKYAYLGSRSHFFSSLWANSLKSNGFLVENSANEALNYEDIVLVRDSFKKYLEYYGKLKVLSEIPGKAIQNIKINNTLKIYYLSKTPNSYIELLKDTVYFDRSGYFEGSGVRILGQMAKQRISDLLPYDYNPVLSGQDSTPDQKKYSSNITKQPDYDSLTYFEKVYLHTDRTFYFPGDDIWFKAYLIDAADRLLSNHSNNLHVELISPSSKIKDSRIIRLDDGLGNGDFKLPDDLSTGRYKLRAYTNYMRNFSDQLFFNKEIIVINSTDEKDKISDEVNYVENKIQLTFFPEGGSLIDNVSSIVAFKATNSIGKGCDISGKIYSSNGDFITTFKSTHLGMGSFLLKPSPGLSYYSISKGADSIGIKTELPKSFSDGVTFSASINQNNELLITTRSNPQTFQLISEHDLLLKISQRKQVIRTLICKVKSPVTNFIVPTDDLPDGILMFTLSALDDTPLAERLIYIQREDPVSILIETDKLLYNKREPVSLKISIPGDSNILRTSNVSLSVVNKNLIENTSEFPRNISSWFLLESDVRGSVEDPSYYFDPSNPERFRDLDFLLLTQGWRDFAWKYDKEYFPPENGFTISGRLRKYSFNKPIENSRVSIGIFGNNSRFLTSVPVDPSGRFSLSGIDFTGEARLIVTGIGKKGRLQGELHLDSLYYISAKVSDSLPQVSILVENKWSELKTYFEINESIRKQYKLSDTIKLGEVKIIAERQKDPQTIKIERSRNLYDQPDSEVKITQQMLSYPYLIEILRGHVPGVVVTGSYPDYKVIIRGLSSIHAQGQPLILVDGNQASIEDLISMPIPAVDRIDVLKTVASASIFGLRGSNGVINIITKAGDWAYVPVTYSHNIRISGYNAARVFYSPQHLDDSDPSYEPDLRSTLLWEPDINLDGNKEVILNYYNGDNSSAIKIIAEGITTSGLPITGKTEYEVK